MAGAFSVHGFDEKIFGADEQVPGRGQSDLRSEKDAPYVFLGSNDRAKGRVVPDGCRTVGIAGG